MLGHFDFIDEASEEISNSAYIATHTRIILRLKLLDELAFSTLRPVSHLHPFVEGLLATSGFAWILGLTGSGKTFVARRIGMYVHIQILILGYQILIQHEIRIQGVFFSKTVYIGVYLITPLLSIE